MATLPKTTASAHDLVLDRVRKLLALSSSSNVHEAASAAALAQKLIVRHRLERWLDTAQSTVSDDDPIEDDLDAPLESAKRMRTWKVILATTLAEANGCVAYTHKRGKEKAIVLVGRKADRDAVRALWTWLVKRIEWLSATHGAGQDRQWHKAFRIGVVATVGKRLTTVTREASEELREARGAQALIRLEPGLVARQAALDRFVSQRLSLKRGRGVRVDAEAFRAGREAGADLSLTAPGAGEASTRVRGSS